MFNVLVTGSEGFIGKNLIQKLDKDSVNILTFSKQDTVDDLKRKLFLSDFIYHFAGEVRPNSSAESFEYANVTLTKTIVEILTEYDKKTSILLTSSIHAKLLKNDYGKTKRESEKLIEKYSKKSNVPCFIYRLPHVFGEGCKINYNSVVSTWIYNSINNLEINVFNRDISMTYVYVQDIVDVFIEKLSINKDGLYQNITTVYHTTLGDIVDYLEEFKENIENPSFEIIDNDFKEKLFNTYKNYYLR